MDGPGGQVGAIGIDFGTTNCCTAIYTTSSGHPEVQVLENDEGSRITPSFIFFTERNKILVGNLAKKMANAKPQYSVSEIKRLLGRKFNDPTIRNNIGYFSFEVHDIDNVPTIIIENPNGENKKTPEELATIMFRKIKQNIEAKFENNPADKAVITVPAYFGSAQREAVLKSAENAGFTVLKLLNEPTAAALSYFYHHNNLGRQKNNADDVPVTGLVFDLGGGTFDVAILSRKHEKVTILGVDGDTHLGGQDLDNLLVDYVIKYLSDHHGYNAKDNRRVLRILKTKCEEAKIQLSFMEDTLIDLTLPKMDDDVISVPISCKQFEDLAMPLLRRTITIVERCLGKTGLKKEQIDVVIMSGGSTRIPKVNQMLSQFFDGKTLNKSVPPEECVAEGAAIQAAMLSTNPLQSIEQMEVTDVIPLSLGISDFVDCMTFVISRNTQIPVSKTVSRITVYDKQDSVAFQVYEGERLNANLNYYLGNLEITGITPAPPGQCEITVTMSVDKNGILTLAAKEVLSGKEKILKITYTRGSRSDDEVAAAIQDATENKADDEKFKEFVDRKAYVMKYCIKALYNFENMNMVTKYQEVYNMCNDILRKVKTLRNWHQTGEVLRLRKQVLDACGDIANRHKFLLMP